jgi:hypothetical protein
MSLVEMINDMSSMLCPKCNGPVWDNRVKKDKGIYKRNAPDFTCKEKVKCGWKKWPTKDMVKAALMTPMAEVATPLPESLTSIEARFSKAIRENSEKCQRAYQDGFEYAGQEFVNFEVQCQSRPFQSGKVLSHHPHKGKGPNGIVFCCCCGVRLDSDNIILFGPDEDSGLV